MLAAVLVEQVRAAAALDAEFLALLGQDLGRFDLCDTVLVLGRGRLLTLFR